MSDLPFQLHCSGFKYLSIHMTHSLSNISTANITPLIIKIKSDIKLWFNLPLSLVGKINGFFGATRFQKYPGISWCTLERSSCQASSLPALFYSSVPVIMSHYADNSIVQISLKVWFQFRHRFKFGREWSVSGIICEFKLCTLEWKRNQMFKGFNGIFDFFFSNLSYFPVLPLYSFKPALGGFSLR